MNFRKENKVFQRPCRSVLLPSYCFATTVVNYYDRSIFSMTGYLGLLYSLAGQAGRKCGTHAEEKVNGTPFAERRHFDRPRSPTPLQAAPRV